MESDKKRKSYEQQFKIGAVNMVTNGNRSVASVARDLGIEVNLLHRWKRELTEGKLQAFPGKGRLSSQEEELRRSPVSICPPLLYFLLWS